MPQVPAARFFRENMMELTHKANRSGKFSTFLRGEMVLSSGLMNKLKWQERLLVNGIPRHTDYPVEPGDILTVCLDEPEPDYPAEDGDLTVLYEDEHLLAVDKPAGMLVHPSRTRLTGTLANLVAGYYRRTGQKCAFHPVTRLDRDTYGIVLLAKNAYVHAMFTQMQEQKQIVKIYHAAVLGGPEKPEGVIDAPIERLPLPSLLRRVSPEGKPSLTRYQVLQRQGEFTKLALQPITGRTHQLRVHCAYMGYPILGDPQYGGEKMLKISEELKIPHQILCAKTLEFLHPLTKQDMCLCSRMDGELPKIKTV